MKIDLVNEHPGRAVDEAALTRRLLRVLELAKCRDDCELSVVLVDDPRIAELNQQYLDRQGPTNVISFPMDEAGGEGPVVQGRPFLLGDVVVSLDTAAREAADNGLEPGEHTVRLLIHGILHLLGHDHLDSEEQARAMEDLTERLLEQSADGI